MTEQKQFLVDGGKLKREMQENLLSLIDIFESKNLGWGWEFNLVKFEHLLKSCRVPILHPEKIEAAIKMFQEFESAKPLTLKEVADLLRWVLKQKSTWTDKDFGL